MRIRVPIRLPSERAASVPAPPAVHRNSAALKPNPMLEREADRLSDRMAPGIGFGLRQGGSTPHAGAALDRAAHEHVSRSTGFDFSRIRIHSDTKSAEMADALNADAFTVGPDIYVGAGALQRGGMEANRLLGHELAHAAQQSRTGPALQPKLKMTGKPADLTRAITLLNSGLHKFRASIDASGAVTITENFVETNPNPQQKALADRLKNIIDNAKDVVISISAGSKTLVGSYATGDIDITDVEAIGVHAFIHEIEEQFQKQAMGVAYGGETSGAHGEGIKAESEVFGAKRGPQKVVSSKANADGTLDAVIEVPFTFPDGTTKTQVMTIKSNNVASVVFK
jgi:hypothetical protein